MINAFCARAQSVNPALLTQPWPASWVSVPAANPTGYGVYVFRKSFTLAARPSSLVVHVSADNRYKLFVNEQLVSLGPARGDVTHWNYETIELAPFLHPGPNVVAAQVWNEGPLRAEPLTSFQTGFILQADTNEGSLLNTNSSWKCLQDKGYLPQPVAIPTYYVAGPGEQLVMQQHPRGWEKQAYADSNWPAAKEIAPGLPKNQVGFAGGGANGWLLVPSSLPQMELKPFRLATVRAAKGVVVPAAFPAAKASVTIPAHTAATLLLDLGYLTNAYPTLRFSGGGNSSITLAYQEALFTHYPLKGNRNDIKGKVLIGRKDSLLSDGSDHQEFTSLAWRTFRYLQLSVTTKDAPLVLEDLYGTATGYPFKLNTKLDTKDAELQKILEIGWRTARLCAVETYMDCPYYEQLQYIGDARIQALVSLYNSGDDRLVRNALDQIAYSQQPEGVTLSRYPSSSPQYIPPFSLWYIGMLHDYMQYGKDSAFVAQKLMSVRQVLTYFYGFQQADGSVKNLPWWNFTDWVTVPNWTTGTRAAGADGNSALIDLQLLWAYELAADMEQKLGMKEYAALYGQRAAQLKKTIQAKYWDDQKNLFADRSEKDLFSQHANALAILTGLIEPDRAAMIGQQLLADTTLAPASIYFKYYLHLALTKAGYGDKYLSLLGKWRENMNLGLTTWAETSEIGDSRSDCHAWGASPNIELYRIVLGIDSDALGFAKVKIEPHLGAIKAIGGEMPHPNGTIRVKYRRSGEQLTADVELPVGVTGQFVWRAKSYALTAGKNTIKI